MKYPGYLLDAKQLTAFAKWYMSDPLGDTSEHYGHAKIGQYAKRRDYETMHTAQEIIAYVKKHPEAKAFRTEIYSNPVVSFTYNDISDNEIGAYLRNNGQYDHEDQRTLADYVDYLQMQTLLSYQQIITKAKQINNKRKPRNARVNAWNAKLDTDIVKYAKQCPKNVHYRCYLNVVPCYVDKLMDKCFNHDFGRAIGLQDDINNYMTDKGRATDLQDDIHEHVNDDSVFRFKNGHIYYRPSDQSIPQDRHFHKLNVYGEMLVCIEQKRYTDPIIDLDCIPRHSAFESDFKEEINSYSNGYSKPLTDLNMVVDYKRFIADRINVKA